MESNKEYELYKQTNDAEYIKIINNNPNEIARRQNKERKQKRKRYRYTII